MDTTRYLYLIIRMNYDKANYTKEMVEVNK